MPVLETQLNARSADFQANAAAMRALVDDLNQRISKAQLGGAMRNSLTVARANRLIERLAGGKGARISSQNVPIHHDEDLEDVIALLLHAQSTEARYRVEVPTAGEAEARRERDQKLGYGVERFFVIKK